MAEKNIKIMNIENGMFQYSIVFQTAEKIKIHTQLLRTTNQIHTIQQDQSKINATSKCSTKSQKRVTFTDKPSVKLMYSWKFAYIQARKDIWQQEARDRKRFERRIGDLSKVISPILEKKYKKIIQNSQMK